MAGRQSLGCNVFDAATERIASLMRDGNRLVVSFSAGKDSNIVLELAIIAARQEGCLPLDVVMRDEEIMLPGTYEYAERVAARPEVRFHWLVANQPVVNIFNRRQPYFWVFDPLLPPDRWVRQPPAIAEYTPDKNIDSMTTLDRFPPAPGKQLMAVLGIRIQESRGRMYGLFSAKGHVPKPKRTGVRSVWPIYDWQDGDVWRAINENHWDYNTAYDALHKAGINRNRLRIAPPTMAGPESLQAAARTWPKWFDAVCERLEGVRQVALYGARAAQPHRRGGESWEQCFRRECLDDAPTWIAERATREMNRMLGTHAHHSGGVPFPEIQPCRPCYGSLGSWRKMAMALYNGDPFSQKTALPFIEPEFFREGAGTWGGSPTF